MTPRRRALAGLTAGIVCGLLLGVPALGGGAVGAQGTASVTGVVRGSFHGSVAPLPFATVQVWAPGVSRTAVADSLGRYQVTELPSGALTLRASHPGHLAVTVSVMVPEGGQALVDVELQAAPLRLPPVDVTASRGQADDSTALGAAARESSVEAVALATGSGLVDAGLADAIRTLGGNDPAQPTDVLFMRGSTTDLKLVLLDGAPVYTPFHVAGLMRSFDPDVLGRADMLVGGAPARYDGGLSYILDLRTRTPRRDRVHASGSLDLLAGTLAADGPLGDHAGFLVSGRALHDLGRVPLGDSPYGYGDVLLGLDIEPARDQRVRATGFWNRESVRLDLPGTLGIAPSEAPGDAWWTNRAASLNYQGRIGGSVVDAVVASGGYDATLPLQPTAPAGKALPPPVLATARNDRLRASLELARPTSLGTARFGVSFEDLRTSYRATVLSPDSAGTLGLQRAEARSGGAYVDVSRSLGPSVVLRTGLRADAFSGDGALRLAPRVALTWMVAPQAFLTLAAGRYHQGVWAGDATLETALVTPTLGDTTRTETLPVATADHLVVSLDQTVGEKVRLGVAGFWKGYRGLQVGRNGQVQSSGVDLRVQRPGERGTVWLGYQLAWYWSSADLWGTTSDFSARHVLSAGVSGAFTDFLGGDVRLAYGSGLPYTSVPLTPQADRTLENPGPSPQVPTFSNSDGGQSPPLAGGVEENFFRVDVEVHATLHPSWLGRRWTVHPYLRVLNALDRRDALFYAFQPWRSAGLTPLAERPVVPVLGIDWHF